MTDEHGTTPTARPEPPRRVVDIPGIAPGARRPEPISDAQEKKLIVGREICLSGNITACDTLVVEGTVEANLSESRSIEITRTGVFKGTAEIDVAEISGSFEGELNVRSRLVIQSTGRVKGKVRYAELEINRGGQISGEIEVIEVDTAANASSGD